MSEAENKKSTVYKTIQLGPKSVKIPNDWAVTKIADISKVNYGKSLPDSTGNIPAIGSSGIYNRVGESLIEEDTIVVGRKGSAGESYLLQQPCWPSDTAFYLSDFNTNEMDIQYLHYYMSLNSLVEELEQTTIPSLDRTRLETYQIITPPLPEQRRIADILSTVDEQIQQTSEKIGKTKELRQTLIYKLLTTGVNKPTETKSVRMGPLDVEISAEWRHAYFDDVIELNPRDSIPDESSFEYLPMDAIDESRQKITYWNERTAEDCTSIRFKEGDTVYAKITPCTENGKIAYIGELDGDMAFGSTELFVFRALPDELIPKYVYYLTNHPLFRAVTISLMEGSTGRQRVPTDIFKQNLKIPVPSLSEQRTIVEILDAVGEDLDTEYSRKQELQQLKRGLMQDLLTGTKRVDPKQA